MACDLCGKTGEPLLDLLQSYQTTEIKCICYDCNAIVNKQHGKLRTWAFALMATLLKRWMSARRRSRP